MDLYIEPDRWTLSYLLAMIEAARANETPPANDSGQVGEHEFMAALGGKVREIKVKAKADGD